MLIANPQGWKVTYRGGVGAVPTVLDSMLAGGAVKAAASEVAGCPIKMPERDKKQAHAQISYEKTIAPMLMDKCVACHRTGGIGPWQMTSYDMIKGFAPMIREVVRTQRMPPWDVDPHYSVFRNDRGLSTEQARTLVHWIEAGAPRGSGADPLLAQKKDWPEWPLGKPDLIIELPAFTVPATGTIPYQMTKVENPLDHDVWVRAVDWVPGERSVVHHIIASAGGAERRGAVSLNNYVPGVEPLELPPEAGILLPAKATFHFQMHYTSSGKVLTDKTKLGLYFRKDAPKYNFRSLVFANNKLRIPPNTKWHEEVAEQTVKADAIIYTLHPHAHYRGKASRFVAYYPDGKEQTLLNIPAYDFNWQGTYELDRADEGAGGHAHRVHAVVRQLDAEQSEPRRQPRSDVGRADVGRDDLRRDPLSQRDRRRAGPAAEGPVAGRAVHREAASGAVNRAPPRPPPATGGGGMYRPL